MLTKNFKKTHSKSNDAPTFKFISGSTYTTTIYPGSYSADFLWVGVGSGETEPTIDDYSLESVLSNLTLVSRSTVWGKDETPIMYNATTVYRNDTSSPITVKEVALYYAWQGYTDANNSLCFARSVLETPVTIGVGETYTFNYSIEI